MRSLLDVWVMEHKMGIPYSCAQALLEKAGIYQFAAEMSKLAELCFTQNERESFSDPLLEYIFQGGLYGSAEKCIAFDKYKNGSSVAYAIKRLFLPYKDMVRAFPYLKKAPFLLPLCWMIRLIKVLFGGESKRIVSEMTYATKVSDERFAEITAICTRLGL